MQGLYAVFVRRFFLAACCALAGCGATKTRVATEQLLISDAVDRAVAHIDFRGLSGQKVFLDTKYIEHIRTPGQGPGSVSMVNADYIISSMHQQMLAAGVLLQAKADDADYIVELRCGAIASDGHEVVYGVPANNALSSASSFVPGAPPMPTIPEIALAKRNDNFGAAKIGVFAYHRVTKEPVWRAGIAQARSTSKDVWLFGAGPFQRGTIYDAPRFAGSKLEVPLLPGGSKNSESELAGFEDDSAFATDDEDDPKAEGKKRLEPPAPEPLPLPSG
jgi:hypothetical protein